MNKLLLFLTLNWYSGFAINCNDSINLKGYLIMEYDKNEVLKAINNQEKKKNGESYSVSIDTRKKQYFISKDSIKSSLRDEILTHSSFYKSIVFSIPTNKRTREFLSERCKCKTPENILFYGDQYYTMVDKNNKKLYRIYYVEAKALLIQLENNLRNRLAVDISDDEVQPNKEFKIVIPYSYEMIVEDFILIHGFELFNRDHLN